MPKFRAKLTVVSIGSLPGCDVVKFAPDYSASPEDQSFSAATPGASLEMSISNPALLGKLVVGQTYYLDFTLASDEQGYSPEESA